MTQPDMSKKFVWDLNDVIVSRATDLEKEVEERDTNHDTGLEQLQGPYSPKGGYPGDGLWG